MNIEEIRKGAPCYGTHYRGGIYYCRTRKGFYRLDKSGNACDRVNFDDSYIPLDTYDDNIMQPTPEDLADYY